MPVPDPSQSDNSQNAYVFARRVEFTDGDGTARNGFIDLRMRGSFGCAIRQGVERRDEDLISDRMRAIRAARRKGLRDASAWNESLVKARSQAEQYAQRRPAAEGRPPFHLVIDVGYCIELYSEFSCTGGTFVHFT